MIDPNTVLQTRYEERKGQRAGTTNFTGGAKVPETEEAGGKREGGRGQTLLCEDTPISLW